MSAYELICTEGFWMHGSRERAIQRNPEAFARLRELAEGKIVYELGPGHKKGFLRFLYGVKFVKYVGIGTRTESSTSGRIGFTILDGLGYLASVPDESGIVISSAFFNRQILVSDKYLEELIRQIERVTPSGASTVHFDIDLGRDINHIFNRYGLKPKRLGRKINLGGLSAEVYEYKKAA